MDSWNIALIAEYPAAVAAAEQVPAVLAELLRGDTKYSEGKYQLK